MIGSNETFTNDFFPKSKNKDWKFLKTRVCKGATIEAGSTILLGLTIDEGTMIGAESIVTKKFSSGRIMGWMSCYLQKKKTRIHYKY